MAFTVEVEPVYVESGNVTLRSRQSVIILRRFQEETIDFFSSPHRYLFLIAPTGSGKTFTLLAPLLSNIIYGTRYDGALGIYPTKPLTVDQFESLRAILGKLGNETRSDKHGVALYDLEFVVTRNSERVGYYRGRVGLVLLTRDNIEKLREALDAESKQGVLDIVRRTLLTGEVDYLVTLAVPEYPYFMFSHMYRNYHDLAKLLDLAASGGFVHGITVKMLSLMNDEDKLREYVGKIVKKIKVLIEGRVAERKLADLSSALLPPILFFDEFHTWGSYELPTAIALVLLHRLVALMSTRREMYRVIFSSATPSQNVASVLSRIAGEHSMRVVEVKPVNCGGRSVAKIRGKTVVELYPIATRASGYLMWAELDRHLPTVVNDKASEILSSKRAIVFGRRVWSVEESAKVFYDKTNAVPTVVTGFTPPPLFHGKEELASKKADGELYVFGNYAVELGVDLQNMTYSVISAMSLGELVQRMGRSGRGGIDSKVVILIPKSYAGNVLERLGGKSRVQYYELIDALSWVMMDEPVIKKLGDRAILKSKIGKLRMYLPLANYVLVSVLRYRDKPRDLEPILSEFVKIVQVVRISKEFFSWLRRRTSKNPHVLVEIASYRLSPSAPYVRAGSGNQIDGEANPVTLLSNYDVEVDVSSGFKLVIKGTKRREIREVVTLVMEAPSKDLLKSVNGSILPAKLALELVEKTKPVHNLLTEILKRIDAPLYVVYTGGEKPTLEVLRAYGQALALECSGKVYAYLSLL